MKIRMLVLPLLAACLAGCVSREPQPVIPETTAQTAPAVTAAPTLPPPPTETEPAAEPTLPPPGQKDQFVCVADYIPDVLVELKYATEDNFTEQVIYGFSEAYLRYGTVEKLTLVQADLRELGMGLKIWDAFRPVSAQFDLWEAYPDSAYVANPNTGYSAHSRGNTLDVTLTDSRGRELLMPTAFDDFSSKADRDYSDCDQAAADNALILELLMEKHGFKGYRGEWWHFTDEESYPVEKTFAP